MKHILSTFLVTLAVGLTVTGAVRREPVQEEEYFVYFGTYTEFKLPSPNHFYKSQSKGIYVSRFRPSTGDLSAPELAAETINPSFLVVHPNQRYLYAVVEDPLAVGNLQDKASFVRSFAINRATGKLSVLNTVPSNGGSSCFLSMDPAGKFVMVANFTTGSVVVWRVKDDGSLGEQTSFMQHTGQGLMGPHAHWIGLSPDNRFAVAAELGLDQLRVYRFDSVSGSLTPNDPPFVRVAEGSGPRHFTFAANGKFAYALTEFTDSVIAFSWDSSKGILKEIQTIDSIPEGTRVLTSGSELILHPSGKFLYAGNRGSDTITVFAVDPEKGTLKRIQQDSTRGMMPRDFRIDPTGKYLLVANELTDDAVLFEIDGASGLMTLTRTVVKVDSPSCVKFARIDLPY